jgi:hypothetical protein
MLRAVVIKRIVFCILPAATLVFIVAALRELQQSETTKLPELRRNSEIVHATVTTETFVHTPVTTETFVRVINPHLLTVNVSDMFPCVSAEIDDITFPICTYTIMEDVVVSGTFLRDGYFEADVVSRVVRRLREDDTVQLVDIGANVGTYALLVP